MAAKKFEAQPDDTYTRWSWETGYLILNTRYYLTAMPKTKRTELEKMMNRLNAKMEVSIK